MKQVVGIVVSNKMQKSVVVAVDRLFHHKLYNRYVKRTSKFMAHDEKNDCSIGDRGILEAELSIPEKHDEDGCYTQRVVVMGEWLAVVVHSDLVGDLPLVRLDPSRAKESTGLWPRYCGRQESMFDHLLLQIQLHPRVCLLHELPEAGRMNMPPKPFTDGQAVHRDKLMLLLGSSLIGLTPGILANETIGCLHKGQGMDPGGTNKLVEVLVVEHRYRPHLVQNSWLQPVM
ncbi:hypothetical protein ZIOFF_033229 [Zingiber officinale]|uniref:30S ribosomal protein S17, chloroplastic n=1 Tax=Zingiber officinale TaxID=94328 RepID=A0A8J5LC40_ZINOF|nr:hypothetical protein ZIOFF_033229 [Zingiber officinale]